ncbi:hypothetical protein BDW22DRAFT_1351049 [Trametopsis cervina]|nr:hypothetical protein BDW22DRAFT_1351049 [Trametopsis cervina]
MFTLPDVPGPYPVGATTFAVPIDLPNPQDRIVGDGKVKATAAGNPHEPALKLEELAFTAFYPAEVNGGRRVRKGMAWLPNPVWGTLRGYAHFSKWRYSLITWLLGIPARYIKIPVYSNAPLLDPQDAKDFPEGSWPLVLFSHGLAGNRTNYSHFCSRLASHGNVVLAFEHRDGTGPFIETLSSVPGRHEPKSPDYKLYLHPDDVIWDETVDRNKYPLKKDQLRFRQLEIYLAYTHFKRFVSGVLEKDAEALPQPEIHTIDGPWNFNLTSRSHDRQFWESWLKTGSRPKVECDTNICLAGHSFGGATVLSVLSTKPPTFAGQEFPHIPFTHAIALDPWMDPLPSPVPAPLAAASSVPGERSAETPRLLVINSEGFTLWDDHFKRLEDVVRSWNEAPREDNGEARPGGTEEKSNASGERATLVTIVRSQHISFSDFGVLVPFGRLAREGKKYLDVTCELAVAFLQGRQSGGGGDPNAALEEVLARQTKVAGEVEPINVHKPDSETEWKKRIVGEVGDIVVH